MRLSTVSRAHFDNLIYKDLLHQLSFIVDGQRKSLLALLSLSLTNSLRANKSSRSFSNRPRVSFFFNLPSPHETLRTELIFRTKMAVRAVNSCAIFRSASSPPLSAVRCRLYSFSTFPLRSYCKLGFRFPILRPDRKFFAHGGVRSSSVHSLVESVMEELEFMRKRKRVCAVSK